MTEAGVLQPHNTLATRCTREFTASATVWQRVASCGLRLQALTPCRRLVTARLPRCRRRRQLQTPPPLPSACAKRSCEFNCGVGLEAELTTSTRQQQLPRNDQKSSPGVSIKQRVTVSAAAGMSDHRSGVAAAQHWSRAARMGNLQQRLEPHTTRSCSAVDNLA